MHTIALTGFAGGAASASSPMSRPRATDNYGIVEDAHQACMHLLAQSSGSRG